MLGHQYELGSFFFCFFMKCPSDKFWHRVISYKTRWETMPWLIAKEDSFAYAKRTAISWCYCCILSTNLCLKESLRSPPFPETGQNSICQCVLLVENCFWPVSLFCFPNNYQQVCPVTQTFGIFRDKWHSTEWMLKQGWFSKETL